MLASRMAGCLRQLKCLHKVVKLSGRIVANRERRHVPLRGQPCDMSVAPLRQCALHKSLRVSRLCGVAQAHRRTRCERHQRCFGKR